MTRINIIGCSGSGKSTFGKRLSGALNIEYYELDSLFWKPNWVQANSDDFFSEVEAIVNKDSWVIDGNYRKVEQMKFHRADTVIWIDTPFILTMFQGLKRAIIRIRSREELWDGTGNRETIKKTFFSRNSILLWTLTSYKRVGQRYSELFKSDEYDHIEFVRLRTRKEKKLYLKNIEVGMA